MLERRGLSLLAREPLYNTRAVVQRTPHQAVQLWLNLDNGGAVGRIVPW